MKRASILGLVLLAACGAADKVNSVVGDKTIACDWTALVTSTAPRYRECLQATGPAAAVDEQAASCAPSSGVLRGACPATGGTGLVGCCSVQQFGLATSTCYYDARYAAAETACRNTTVNGDPAVWTTTVPAP
jgi:hypothetical protein